MTLLGAVTAGECVYIAADSLQAWPQAGYGDTVDKLKKLQRDEVVWGWYGNSAAALDFADKVESFPSSFGNWDNLTLQHQQYAEMLNRKHHREGGFAVLFAGRLLGNYSFRAYGGHTLLANDDWCFVGQSRLAAKVAWLVLTAADAASDRGERLRLVMGTTIDASQPYLGPPLGRWRIDANGCTDLGATP